MKKTFFLESIRQYYRENPLISRSIDEFEKNYRSNEVINWCFRSPFPSRYLFHALRAHNKEQLNVCRSILIDALRFFAQHTKSKTTSQFYRGMKLPNSMLEQFEAHVNQLVCANGFFPSTRSRASALALASLPAYRPDLLPVLFKIDCDPSTSFVELTDKNPSSIVAFNIDTTFTIVYVNRGPMTVIKMKAAGEQGKKIAVEYLQQHKDKQIYELLDELAKPPTPPKPPTPKPAKYWRVLLSERS